MLVPFRELLGAEPDAVDTLVDYGYRAAWKVRIGDETYLVKADNRPGFCAREAEKHQHALSHGLPVPPFFRFVPDPSPCVAFAWAEGEPLTAAMGAHAWRAAGATLRCIHELPVLPEAETWGSVSFFENELGWMVEQGTITVGEAQSALAVGHGLEPTVRATPRTWVHADCQPAHFIMDPVTHEVSAVIDWADAQPGTPDMDFAVLTLFEDGVLDWVLEGYGGDSQLRERLALTIPLYQAIRAAGSLRWLETHGYPGHTWPAERVRALFGR